jgi:hypothetical protein
MTYIFLILVSIIAFFILFHLRPLNENEVVALSTKRRNKSISQYYSFDRAQYSAHREAKKSMPANGGYCSVDWPLRSAPPLAASLLKYKKHEWVIFGFEKEKVISYLWMNKGNDKTSVVPKITTQRVMEICAASRYNSVQVFHNHPNPNGFATSASQADFNSANQLASTLNNSNVALLEYVCDRGRPIRFFLSAPQTFLPLTGFKEQTVEQNGVSWSKNLSLHLERIF